MNAAFALLVVRAAFVALTAVSGVVFVVLALRNRRDIRRSRAVWIAGGLFTASLVAYFAAASPAPTHFAMPPTMHSFAPGHLPASIPVPNIFSFVMRWPRFEKVADIGRDPNDVPPPTGRTAPAEVEIRVTAKEVIAEAADGVVFNYWTYDGQVPGPMWRARVGDTVVLTLTNDPSSLHPHNIDLHAVNGPGGGAAVTTVRPGETKSFRWKALNPGLYEYHCAQPNVSTHNAHGQYGLILVEPEGGLPPVDKEFYVMQGELYTEGPLGRKGLVAFDPHALLEGLPNYVTFNGRVEKAPRMKAEVGDRVRMYVGNGGVNLVSSFHVIGEIFDVVHPEGAIGSEPHRDVQTTVVPAGGATIVEFTLDAPGKYMLVDHALARMNKGAWAVLEVEGDPRPEIFQALTAGGARGGY